MIVKRIQVEEGFLNGLDLSLDHGLTVLIGARGSGKTSIIELIRFCLDVPPYTATGGAAAQKQALEVLGSGKVTVTLDVEGDELKVSRSVGEGQPRTSSSRTFLPPIVLSQSEVEQVGLYEDSRQRLLDSFVPSLREGMAAEDASRALIASLTVELRDVLNERRTTEEDLERLVSVDQELADAKSAAFEANAGLEQTDAERARLAQLDQLTAQGSVRMDSYRRAVTAITRRIDVIRPNLNVRPLDPWPTAAGAQDGLATVRAALSEADTSIRAGEAQLQSALLQAQSILQQEQGVQLGLEDEARTLRSYLEQLSRGAGLLLKRVSDLESAQQRAAALKERIINLDERAQLIASRRDEELDQLDSLRESRVNAREQAASFLNSRLGPKIRVNVNRFGSVGDYADSIANALRGSGLQYNVLAPELARTISPRELARAAEDDDPAAIVEITGIALDRAQRLCSHLRDVGTESVLTAPLGDTVQLALLDGGAYKPARELSVGQRCTVVLPIILTHTERVLIVDQPEDNLDNSFIAWTLVKALQNRSSYSQLIFATHNPNVPVLGEADLVVYLRSDGKRGYIDHAGELDDIASVRAISNVMEGGQRAFERRADFYAVEYGAAQDTDDQD